MSYPHRWYVYPDDGTETLTLLAAEMKKLEAFYKRCQWEILDIRWWVHVSNAMVLQRSGLSTVGDILRHRHLSPFGACCTPGPWSTSTWCSASDGGMVDTYEGRKPMASWRRLPGCPRNVLPLSLG